jgi:hypothetical protein
MKDFIDIALITLLTVGGFALFIGICRLISKLLVDSGATFIFPHPSEFEESEVDK